MENIKIKIFHIFSYERYILNSQFHYKLDSEWKECKHSGANVGQTGERSIYNLKKRPGYKLFGLFLFLVYFREICVFFIFFLYYGEYVVFIF